MSNAFATLPVRLDARPLAGPARVTRGAGGRPAPHPHSVWHTLWMVMRQQLMHDAMLMWRFDERSGTVRLVDLAPEVGPQRGAEAVVDESCRQLASGEMKMTVHMLCQAPGTPLERVLREAGLQAAVTACITHGDRDVHLLTIGFRQRWELVSHHVEGIRAFVQYLDACQQAALPREARDWWSQDSQVARLWRQLYRPTILRTVYDLNETLSDAAEQCRARATEERPRAAWRVQRLAQEGALLMTRLEKAYLGERSLLSVEELMAEALLLVRGAHQICTSDWEGCLVGADCRPQPEGQSVADKRLWLVNWLMTQLAAQSRAVA